MCSLPSLGTDERTKGLGVFPEDAVQRAEKYLSRIPGGTGAYSHSQGVHVVREEVAQFIDERDGTQPGTCDPERIFLTDGASPAVQMLLKALVSSPSDGVLIPIPQYPLYSAAIALCGGTQVPYYLEEESNWGTPVRELEAAFEKSKAQGIQPRAVAVINPGNPTGGVLPRDGVAEIVDFCRRRELVLLADEVYQENVWAQGKQFHSFRQVAMEEAAAGDAQGLAPLQLASFHSVSKGFFGECGRRGGYAQLQGFPDDVVAQLYKLASVSLCSNLEGQLMVGLMCRPPVEGDASFPLYQQERAGLLDSLRRRAGMLIRAFESMEGVQCAPPEGALYAFPTIQLPKRAVEAAQAAGKAPDAYYCLQLLDKTGIVAVPGSGFGQKEGTFHLRTTILPPEDKMDRVTQAMATFHSKFLQEHSD